MNIKKVQPNQINFGTKVYLEPETKTLILNSKAKRKFLRHIDKLKNNGIDDVFVLKHEEDNFIVPMTFLNGTVFEKRKDGIFKTPYGFIDTLEISTLDKAHDKIVNQYANILQIYKEAKYECIMRRIDINSYNNYLAGLTTV